MRDDINPMDDHATLSQILKEIKLSGIRLDRLRDLVKAYKDGRCVLLPCKVGDTVWFTRAWYSVLSKPLEGRVTSIRGLHSGLVSFEATITDIGPAAGSSRRFDSDHIGRTVFLDYSKAEAALEKRSD